MQHSILGKKLAKIYIISMPNRMRVKLLSRGKLDAITSAPKGKIIITIDGGSATNKSPISQALAKKFNLVYIEMGGLFRTISYLLMQAGLPPKLENTGKVDEFVKHIKCEYVLEGRAIKFIINGVCLGAKELRAEDINASVAKYTLSFKSVSDACIKYTRKVINLEEVCKFDGVLAEGRTCCTYIFPKADIKFWFMATDAAKLNLRLNIEKEVDNPIERDRVDFSATFYPVTKPKHAIEIWTSSRTVEENIALVSAFVEQKLDLKKYNKTA